MTREWGWLRRLVEAYFDPHRHTDLLLDDDDPEVDTDREGAIISQVLALPSNEPEECWRFLQIACELPISDEQLGLLGAGIFEDLMDDHGAAYIDRVEAAFVEARPMRVIVKSTWTMSMTPEIAQRIGALQALQIG